MKTLKSLIPPFIKLPLIYIIEWYHLTTYYRNKIRTLGGRLSGYFLQGGKLTGFDDGTYENDLCLMIEKYVEEGMTCVDVGGHIGYITMLFAKLTGIKGRVVVFEAHPINAQYIKKNIKLNNLSAYVSVENIAISDGTIPFVTLEQGRMKRTAEWKIKAGNQNAKEEFTIPAKSLDQYFKHGERVDFIKMDIEGAEEFAIPGMSRLIREYRPIVCIEFHHDAAWNASSILVNAQYKLYDIQKRQWIQSNSDNRIYHCLAIPQEKLNNLSDYA